MADVPPLQKTEKDKFREWLDAEAAKGLNRIRFTPGPDFPFGSKDPDLLYKAMNEMNSAPKVPLKGI